MSSLFLEATTWKDPYLMNCNVTGWVMSHDWQEEVTWLNAENDVSGSYSVNRDPPWCIICLDISHSAGPQTFCNSQISWRWDESLWKHNLEVLLYMWILVGWPYKDWHVCECAACADILGPSGPLVNLVNQTALVAAVGTMAGLWLVPAHLRVQLDRPPPPIILSL